MTFSQVLTIKSERDTFVEVVCEGVPLMKDHGMYARFKIKDVRIQTK